MDFSSLVERAKRRLSAGQPEVRTWPDSTIDIAACVKQSLSDLAEATMANPSTRSLLQQDYTVTLNASGVGDPFAATGSVTSVAGEILMEGIKHGLVLDNDSNPL